MKKKIKVSQFADELISRIEEAKSIDCCKEELISLAKLAQQKIGDELIEVTWQDR